MSGWPGPLVGFDTETTGVDPANDRVVTAALVERRGTQTRQRTWLADPGIAIPERASAVHGITTEQARAAGRPRREVVGEVLDLLEKAARRGVPIVIYNARFDYPLVEHEATRLGLTPLSERLGGDPLIVDPLVIDRWKDPYRKGKRTLGALAQTFGVSTTDRLHDAAEDVGQTLAVLDALAQRHPDLASAAPDELMEAQARAHREWAEGFNAWLSRNGRTPDIGVTWPK